MSVRIPLAKPEVTDADRGAVLEVLRTPHLSMGPKLRQFEQAICDYTGSKFAVAMNSGTSALQVAVRALGIERGAEVVLPSFTFAALLNVILQEGLTPKFVDIDLATFNTTPEFIAAAITAQTRLVIAVHTFGIPLDVERIRDAIARKNSQREASQQIHLIEDACEALGAEIHGHKAGTFGEAGLFAFYPNKQITTGEGGVLITSDERLAREAARLRNQGRDPQLGWAQHAEVGFSYRLSDINCALGISQLERIESVNARRQKIAETYDRALRRIADVARPSLTSSIGRISWFVYPILLSPDFSAKDRDWICKSLAQKEIESGRYFAPLHVQPVLRSHSFGKKMQAWGAQVSESGAQQGWGIRELRNTESVAERIIALPFFNQLTEAEIHEVCGALEASLRELRRKM
jgi:dTDP-4-amino-4,6-dideoxygalactose transaminase